MLRVEFRQLARFLRLVDSFRSLVVFDAHQTGFSVNGSRS